MSWPRPLNTWWRSHTVRVRLTLWYAAAMVVVLGVYAVGVYTFVSRSVSNSLDERLRADFFWVASTVDEGPDGMIMPVPTVDLLLEEEQPWVQIWSANDILLLNNDEAAPPSDPRGANAGGAGRRSHRGVLVRRRADAGVEPPELHPQPSGRHPGGAVRSADA